MKMKKLSEYLFMGALGGTLYYMIEIIFRGYSHWSMFLLGGICFIFFAQQGLWTKWREPLWKQVLWCTAFVVSAEFITGIIVKLWDGMSGIIQISRFTLWGRSAFRSLFFFRDYVHSGLL